jgi:hypothetical protein
MRAPRLLRLRLTLLLRPRRLRQSRRSSKSRAYGKEHGPVGSREASCRAVSFFADRFLF